MILGLIANPQMVIKTYESREKTLYDNYFVQGLFINDIWLHIRLVLSRAFADVFYTWTEYLAN